MPRVVIVHPEMGVYLGSAMGLGFWSRLDPVDQPSAVTFPTPADAEQHMRTWDGGIPNGTTTYPVEPDDFAPDGCVYASVVACVAAGLPAWDPGCAPRVRGMLHYDAAIEHFEDASPRRIGVYEHWLSGDPPEPGERLRPCFADGIIRRCLRVEGCVIRVRAEDGWDLWCDLWRSIYAHWETYGQPPHYRKAAQWLAGGGFMGAAMRNARMN